ncbi:unnamed protein product [Somion occarium]|uniref:C2H2-type domain-containing protein n=1 Tax=Somion occarium TaxID=3059160 RepID=A0ABP1CX55_9APHY
MLSPSDILASPASPQKDALLSHVIPGEYLVQRGSVKLPTPWNSPSFCSSLMKGLVPEDAISEGQLSTPVTPSSSPTDYKVNGSQSPTQAGSPSTANGGNDLLNALDVALEDSFRQNITASNIEEVPTSYCSSLTGALDPDHADVSAHRNYSIAGLVPLSQLLRDACQDSPDSSLAGALGPLNLSHLSDHHDSYRFVTDSYDNTDCTMSQEVADCSDLSEGDLDFAVVDGAVGAWDTSSTREQHPRQLNQDLTSDSKSPSIEVDEREDRQSGTQPTSSEVDIQQYITFHAAPQPPRPYKCLFRGCHKTSKSHKDRAQHMEIHFPNYQCPGCKEMYHGRARLRYHLVKSEPCNVGVVLDCKLAQYRISKTAGWLLPEHKHSLVKPDNEDSRLVQYIWPEVNEE